MNLEKLYQDCLNSIEETKKVEKETFDVNVKNIKPILSFLEEKGFIIKKNIVEKNNFLTVDIQGNNSDTIRIIIHAKGIFISNGRIVDEFEYDEMDSEIKIEILYREIINKLLTL